jgi:hypothetical protein
LKSQTMRPLLRNHTLNISEILTLPGASSSRFVILATWETEIRRTEFRIEPRQIVLQTLS